MTQLPDCRDLACRHLGRAPPPPPPVPRPPPRPAVEASWAESRRLAGAQAAASPVRVVFERSAGLLRQFQGSAQDAAEAVFRAVCGTPGPSAPDTFWLDSADTERSRFSFLGGRGGPMWRRFTCELAEGHQPAGASHRPGPVAARITEVDARGAASSHVEPSGVLGFLERQAGRYRVENGPLEELPFEFWGGLVGYLGYELKAECGGEALHRARDPDACWFFVDRFVAMDHQQGDVYTVALHPAVDDSGQEAAAAVSWTRDALARASAAIAAGADLPVAARDAASLQQAVRDLPTSSRFQLVRGHGRYLDDVAECRRALFEGESYEICLTNTIERRAGPVADPWPLYRVLRAANPAPYAAWLDFSGCVGPGRGPVLCCSSPERFLRCSSGGWLEARCASPLH